jgi:hypothetical protein
MEVNLPNNNTEFKCLSKKQFYQGLSQFYELIKRRINEVYEKPIMGTVIRVKIFKGFGTLRLTETGRESEG